MKDKEQKPITVHSTPHHYTIKNGTKQNLIIGGIFSLLILISVCIYFFFNYYQNVQKKNKELEVKNSELEIKVSSFSKKMEEEKKLLTDKIKQMENNKYNNSLVEITKEELLKDLLKHYPETSLRHKKQILETILEESEKYKINPLILYSLCYVESSFRPWLEHKETTIDMDGKKIKIKAVGLTGVVWEWWGKKLKEANIAETRGDLFDPIINIRAGAFVYNKLYHQPMHAKANYKDESALLRFFGGSYTEYIDRIDSKIAEFVRPNLYRKN